MIITRFGGKRGLGMWLLVASSATVFKELVEIIEACLVDLVVALITSSACCRKADGGSDAVRNVEVL